MLSRTPRLVHLGTLAAFAFITSVATSFDWVVAQSVQAQDDSEGQPEPEDRPDPEPEVSDQADSTNPFDRVLGIEAIGGIDTPFGLGGAALVITPFPYLAFYAGGGIGRSGGRFTGGIRAQAPVGNAAVGLMLGVHGGPLDWDTGGEGATQIHRYWELAAFLHGGISFEVRFDDGLYGRLMVGAETLLTPDGADECSTLPDGNLCAEPVDLAKPLRGWAGLAFGYAFDL